MKIQAFTILSLAASVSAFSTTSPSIKSSTTLSAHSDDNTISRRQTFAAIFSTAAVAISTPALAYQEYLTEPTEAFKESERQRDEFRRKQLVQKKKFNTVLDRFTFESKKEEEFINDLKELKYLVIETEGLPLGIKKDELVKIIRAKKAKGFWPTDVEYNYQALIREIAYQQSPNKDKDIANPL